MPATNGQRGFTLLELLVATTLTAMVLAILLSGLRVTQAAWFRGTERIRAIQQASAEDEAIRAQVSSAVSRQLTTQFEQRQVQLTSFCGQASEARFFSNYSWQGGRNSGLWLVIYRVTRDSEGKERLVASEHGFFSEPQLVTFFLGPLPSADPGFPFGEPAAHIELSYLRPSSPGLPAAWVPEWKCTEQKQLPHGVRIRWQSATQEREITLVIPVWEVPQ